MWCDRCRADVAADVSAETGRAVCTGCGSDVGTVRRPSTDKARELLKRWSSDLPEPIETSEVKLKSTSSSLDDQRNTKTSSGGMEAKPDATRGTDVAVAEPANSVASDNRPGVTPPTEKRPESPRIADLDTEWRDDPPPGEKGGAKMTGRHTSQRDKAKQWPAPAVQIKSALSNDSAKPRSSAGQLLGQFLSYLGILVITGGSAIVVWSYFGGPGDWAPTGWLVATGGQMMLLLGVVTLVSEGLEQSGREMRNRIDLLDHRLERIERLAHKTSVEEKPSPPTTRPDLVRQLVAG